MKSRMNFPTRRDENPTILAGTVIQEYVRVRFTTEDAEDTEVKS
jgi:hypothetical protein